MLNYAAPPLAAGPPQPGLSPEQFQQLADARRRSSKIRRAISVARFDAWTVAIFGGLTLLGAYFSVWALVLGAGMAAVAYVEFQGAQRLRRFDPTACKTLAFNQVFLGLLLLTYAVYRLCTVSQGMAELKAQLGDSPEVTNMMMDVESMARLVGFLIYGTLAAVAIFGQGGTALFYLTRRKHIEAYLAQTPPWIIQAQQAGMPM